MIRSFLARLCLAAALAAAPVSVVLCADADMAGSAEHPVFVRVPGYHIADFAENDDAVDYNYTRDDAGLLAGRRTYFNYVVNADTQTLGEHDIMQFYENIVRRAGGTTIFLGETSALYNTATFKMPGTINPVWVLVTPYDGGAGYFLHVINKIPPKKSEDQP